VERVINDEVRVALDIGPAATLADRTIDITTTGRRSGAARRIEICFYRVGDDIYLSGMPAGRTRDWLINLGANPEFVFHLKNGVVADLAARATVITDSGDRRRVLSAIVDEFNERHTADSPYPRAELDEWVEHSPLALVTFADSDIRD
jgi:deazaflavin-dependent oxidoreductase (nitroreductase family)